MFQVPCDGSPVNHVALPSGMRAKLWPGIALLYVCVSIGLLPASRSCTVSEIPRISPVLVITSRLLLWIRLPAGNSICVPPITLLSIFHPDTSIGIGFGLNSSTHSGFPLLGLGINSLISTTGELDCATAGRNISVSPHTMSSSEKIRRERTGIMSFLLVKSC